MDYNPEIQSFLRLYVSAINDERMVISGSLEVSGLSLLSGSVGVEFHASPVETESMSILPKRWY